MEKKRLSNREYDIMQIMWNSGRPLLASDILKADPGMNINTVQSTLRNLLARKMIRVADIITSGKVLARTYVPIVEAEDYLLEEFDNLLPDTQARRQAFFSAFLQKADDKEALLSELEDLIAKARG